MVTARSRVRITRAPGSRTPKDYPPASLTASPCSPSTRWDFVHQRARGLTAPGGGDQLFELVEVHRRQSNQNCRKAVVVWLGEEFLLVGCEEHVLLEEVADAHRQHARVGNPGLLWRDALLPYPDEGSFLPAVANVEREALFSRARSRQRHRDAAHVVLVGHLRR